MKFAAAFAILATMAAAAPMAERDTAVTDVQVLQYALTLEHLENNFYSTYLAQFSQEDFAKAGHPDWVRNRFQQIAEHEQQHVSLLSGALGAQAVKPCTYKFPVTDVNSFVALASVVENVGVSAYLGAAASIVDKTYLTVAGSILTTEARHQGWMNSAVLKDAAWSGGYDTPLDFNEVFSIASAFITSCPAENPALPFKAFPALAIGMDGAVTTPASTEGAFVQLVTGLGSKTYPVENGKVMLPHVQGIYYGVLTSSSDTTKVNDGNILAGPMIFNNPFDSKASNPVPTL
ncbi:ferritin-like domain-containing protein [Dioszegia hungarica]|uniref:Ferritin-like domain-containing protein n=1 Tax=Dioszegia hungarica TaxID=4972 RepID=A0AA38H5V4_9TREE|nr:ferritin-like domain-containing protein [Dioszegia hungarica]KAI9635072.1 ferritin-like domain-containing protein [Dioszegia hungarica]